MKRFLNNATRPATAFIVLALCACSSDGKSSDAQTVPAAGTAAGAGATAAGGTTAGGSSTAGAAGSSRTATAGTTSAAGNASVAGTSPGAAGASGGATAGSAAPASTRPLSSTLKLPTMMETPGVAPFFHIWRPMDLTKVEGKLPIVAWNNGACSRNDMVFKPLFDKWAGGGYFVLSLTSGLGSSSTTQADQKALVDWVVAEAAKTSGPYAGKLDTDHIIAGGNSCGGITSLGLAAADPRITAIFVLSGSSGMGGANTMVTNAIKIPVAYVVGGTEDIARANAEADYKAFKDGIPSMIVNRSSGDHLMISNNAMVMADAADISINWLDLTTFGLQGALDALKQPTVCTGCMMGLWTLTAKNLETLVKKSRGCVHCV
jgi:hypothetical protein